MQKWAVENPKLDNARRLCGIYFIDPEDEEFKDIMKNTRRVANSDARQRLVKIHFAEVAGKLAVPLEDTRQNTLVLLKLTNV